MTDIIEEYSTLLGADAVLPNTVGIQPIKGSGFLVLSPADHRFLTEVFRSDYVKNVYDRSAAIELSKYGNIGEECQLVTRFLLNLTWPIVSNCATELNSFQRKNSRATRPRLPAHPMTDSTLMDLLKKANYQHRGRPFGSKIVNGKLVRAENSGADSSDAASGGLSVFKTAARDLTLYALRSLVERRVEENKPKILKPISSTTAATITIPKVGTTTVVTRGGVDGARLKRKYVRSNKYSKYGSNAHGNGVASLGLVGTAAAPATTVSATIGTGIAVHPQTPFAHLSAHPFLLGRTSDIISAVPASSANNVQLLLAPTAPFPRNARRVSLRPSYIIRVLPTLLDPDSCAPLQLQSSFAWAAGPSAHAALLRARQSGGGGGRTTTTAAAPKHHSAVHPADIVQSLINELQQMYGEIGFCNSSLDNLLSTIPVIVESMGVETSYSLQSCLWATSTRRVISPKTLAAYSGMGGTASLAGGSAVGVGGGGRSSGGSSARAAAAVSWVT
jgi:hypothetical protein